MFLDSFFPVKSFQHFLLVLTEILATLRGHSGLVKGLTWDPVGKYIASQADDRSLKVWRTLDWQLETSITKPFDEVRAHGPPPPAPTPPLVRGRAGQPRVPLSGAVKHPPLRWRGLCGLALKRVQHTAPGGARGSACAGRCACRPLPWGQAASAGPWQSLHSIQRCDCSSSCLFSLLSFKFCLHVGSEPGVAVLRETLARRP